MTFLEAILEVQTDNTKMMYEESIGSYYTINNEGKIVAGKSSCSVSSPSFGEFTVSPKKFTDNEVISKNWKVCQKKK